MLKHVATLGSQLPNMEACFQSFDCSDDIQNLRRLAKEQRANPGREINAVFLQNAATYQQNRQRALQNAARNLS